jgi:Fe-S-cluster containining protein
MQGLAGFAEYMTESGLGSGLSPEKLSQLTVKVRQASDVEMDGAHRSGSAVACRKGCAHCCYQWVTSTIPEVLLLAQSIRNDFASDHLATLKLRIRLYLDKIAAIPPKDRMLRVRSACPLLEEDLCTAFESRPMSCRMFNALDVADCIRYRQGDTDTPGAANARQIEVGNAMLFGSAVALRRRNLQEAMVEMVPALDIALSNDRAAEQFLDGEPILDSVIVSGYDPSVVARYV